MTTAPMTKTVADKPDLHKALEYTERRLPVFDTARVQTFGGSQTRNLKVRRGSDGLYVVTGKYQKHRTRLVDMHDAEICYSDGQPLVVTYLERP